MMTPYDHELAEETLKSFFQIIVRCCHGIPFVEGECHPVGVLVNDGFEKGCEALVNELLNKHPDNGNYYLDGGHRLVIYWSWASHVGKLTLQVKLEPGSYSQQYSSAIKEIKDIIARNNWVSEPVRRIQIKI